MRNVKNHTIVYEMDKGFLSVVLPGLAAKRDELYEQLLKPRFVCNGSLCRMQ